MKIEKILVLYRGADRLVKASCKFLKILQLRKKGENCKVVCEYDYSKFYRNK